MEVFLFFSQTDELALVEATMQAWEPIQWADPVNIIQAKAHKFELTRRVLADQMATGDHYILADLGCVAEGERAIPEILKRLVSKDGLIGLANGNGIPVYPTGVRVCAKGAVKKWPAQKTDTYDQEHADAVRASGRNVATWPIPFKRLLAS